MGWFYAMFMACFMPWLWHVLCHVCGMFCGLHWEDIVADGKGLFLGWFRVKMACTGAAKELFSTLLNGWALKLQPSGTQLHGFMRNCVAPTHLQTSNFKPPYLSCLNYDSHVLGLYGKIFDSRSIWCSHIF